jgi:hypothetical protein
VKANLLMPALLLFVVTQALVWFSVNLQFVNGYWRAKSFLITMCLGIPTSLCAYYASQYGYAALNGSAWGVRFLGFGMSYVVFPILTFALLGESFFTAKVLICTLLSICILLVQVLF